MRTLVHLSDLHFGRVDPRLLKPLTALVNRTQPDVIAVSGDLTQRAKPEQFEEAKAWLQTLTAPKVVVPGNHDVPYYRVWERVLSPLDNFRRHFHHEVEPEFIDDELAVIGINSARSLTFKGGRINEAQLERLRRLLAPLPKDMLKVVVTHHPFSLPEGADEDDLIGRAKLAMDTFHELGVDLLLAGHMHTTLASSTAKRYPIEGYARWWSRPAPPPPRAGAARRTPSMCCACSPTAWTSNATPGARNTWTSARWNASPMLAKGEAWHEVPRV
jgi:3',5'-cyclic AMP phosphodiesterase CpdA